MSQSETPDDALSRLNGLSDIAKNLPREITQFEMDQAVWSVINKNRDLVIEVKEKGYAEEAFIKSLPYLLRDKEYKWEGVTVTLEQTCFRLVRGALNATVPYTKVLHEYLEPIDVSAMKCDECGKLLFHKEGEKNLVAHRHDTVAAYPDERSEEDAIDQGDVVAPDEVPEYVTPTASFKMADWAPLKVLLQAAALLTEEATLQVQPEGVRFTSMDPSHVALVDVFLAAEAFTGYSCEKGFNVALRTEDYAKKLKMMSARDPLDARFGAANGNNELVLAIRNGGDKYTIRPVEPSSIGPPPMPKLEFTAKWLTTSTFLREMLEKAKDSADQVTFDASPTSIRFTARSDKGEYEKEWGKSDTELLAYDVQELPPVDGKPVTNRAAYSLEYLLPQVKVAPKDSVVTIEFGRNKPLRMTYRFEAEFGNNSYVAYMLAPRVSG